MANGAFAITSEGFQALNTSLLQLNNDEIDLINTSQEFRDALQTAAQEVIKSGEQQELYSQQLGNLLIEQSGISVPEYLKDVVAGSLGQLYTTEYNRIKEKLNTQSGAQLNDAYANQLAELGYE